MEIIENPELTRKILDAYTFQPRTFHRRITRLIGCPRKTVHEVLGTPPQIKDFGTVRLIVGTAGHAILEIFDVVEKEVSVNGYYGHLDMLWKRPVEIKITWIGTKRMYMPHWVKQIKAYCYMEKVLEYDLLVLHIMGDYTRPIHPLLKAWTFKFTQEEVNENWELIKENDRIITEAIVKKRMPWQAGEDWECRDCPYAYKCVVGDEFGGEEKVESNIFR